MSLYYSPFFLYSATELAAVNKENTIKIQCTTSNSATSVDKANRPNKMKTRMLDINWIFLNISTR